MKIAIIHHVSGESAKLLKEGLEKDGHDVVIGRPYKDGKTNYKDRFVVSLGCSMSTEHTGRINKPSTVRTCVDKVSTFKEFKKAKVDTVEWCLDSRLIPVTWDQIVVRDSGHGARAEGISYFYQGEKIPPNKALYTEYFSHRREYRVVVLCNKVVGIYHKHAKDGSWFFNARPVDGFEKMMKQCIKAAKQLEIDYVGFDVVSRSKSDFKVLEANSGALITPEAVQGFRKFFKRK